MNHQGTFLVEIGTEELPPKSLLKLSEVFAREIEKGLDDKILSHGPTTSFATPRRLAVKVEDVAYRQADQKIERRGPALKAAFDEQGTPTKAALGFAKSCSVDIEKLGRIKTNKGEWLSFSGKVAGENTVQLLPEIVERALAALPVPKPMRWGTGDTEFVRPVHWVVMLLGREIVEATILGERCGNMSRGHRFHAGHGIEIREPSDYPTVLENGGFVIADFAKRRALTTRLVTQLAESNDGHAIIESNLLDEVTALVEWPVPIIGSFDEHFLELPREVLVASMQDHQKYFPIESPAGSLTNKFITVSNIESKEPSAVQRGNERVIRPRLSDAAFFWAQDRKTRLDQRQNRLADIVFEKRLGSIKDKTDRVARLAKLIAPRFSADAEICARAAQLSRCDLVTDMVGEFPELQGLMGSYYAAADGEPEAVTQALSEFYQPRFAGDSIPTSEAGRCIAYADKLDTLVGIFAIGSAPTGDKDPYALRRAALGCVRIALESESDVGFDEALRIAREGLADVVETEADSDDVLKFMLDRLRGYFAEQQVPGATVEAVLASHPDQVTDVQRRIEAVTAFQALPEAVALASANKRIANILRKNAIDEAGAVKESLLQEPAEHALNTALKSIAQPLERSLLAVDYATYLQTLVELHDPINLFFDEVMVMCDDPKIRDNRIALLHQMHELFTRVADIARLND